LGRRPAARRGGVAAAANFDGPTTPDGQPIPEPASLALLAGGAGVLILLRRRGDVL